MSTRTDAPADAVMDARTDARPPVPPPIPPTCPHCRQGVLWKDTRSEIREQDEHHWRWWCGNCQKRFRPTEEHLRRFS
ncbi:hypothetical protein ACQPZG_16885 [Streptomyces sp. CA-294286]|uniref:hypothetical protein n=1 Tax=Streptomyces sp. CA-294286 TaxID=3240070 RepID=UPI003D8CF2FD